MSSNNGLFGASGRGRRLSAGLPGPEADEDLAPLAAPEIRARTRIAYVQHAVRAGFQKHVGIPSEHRVFSLWLAGKPGWQKIEQLGLPRRAVHDWIGPDKLTLEVNPRELGYLVSAGPRHAKNRPSSLAFIWDGDWDQTRQDTRSTDQYRFIEDLDKHRDDLTASDRYQALMAEMQQGRPWKSWQVGLYLNSPERILAYLKVYLGYLDGMAANGFDPTRGKDPLPVAISREGEVLKLERGLHRLAMAQKIGLPLIPVRVTHIHRDWWNLITEGRTGAEALEKLVQALPHCRPALASHSTEG